jgi:hypothetical protein
MKCTCHLHIYLNIISVSWYIHTLFLVFSLLSEEEKNQRFAGTGDIDLCPHLCIYKLITVFVFFLLQSSDETAKSDEVI